MPQVSVSIPAPGSDHSPGGSLYGQKEGETMICGDVGLHDTKMSRERRWFVWHGILFEEPNPTGSVY